MRRFTTYFIPSIGQFLFISIFLVLAVMPTGKQMLADADTGYHIRAGEYILANFAVPRHDIFSFRSPPLPWTAHEWLSEVIMALLHRVSGITGLVIFFIFLISLTYFLLYRHLRTRQRNVVFDVLIVLFAVISSQIHWLARPHIFSLLLMVLWYAILEDYQDDRRNRLFLLPPIMILWVNLHGGFLTGFILTGIYFGGNLWKFWCAGSEEKATYRKKIRFLGYTIIACLLASLINPYGYHILLFPFKLVSNRYIMDNVSEWLSPNFHNTMLFKYFLLLAIAMFALSKNPLDSIELLLSLFFLNMSLYSARYILLLSIVLVPILSRQADSIEAQTGGAVFSFLRKRADRISRIEENARGFIWPLATLLAVSLLAAKGYVSFRFEDTPMKPEKAVEFIQKENIRGNMYNNDEFGDYLIYKTYPAYKVFFDGRSDMYGTARFKEFQNIAGFSPGWEAIVEKYDIGWFFIASDSLLTRYLQIHPGWRLIYSDNVANIHVRETKKYRPLIRKYRDVTPFVKEEEEKKSD